MRAEKIRRWVAVLEQEVIQLNAVANSFKMSAYDELDELEKEATAYKELMTPKKPNLIKKYDFKTTGICQNCGNSLMKIYHRNHCGECAQLLDWEV